MKSPFKSRGARYIILLIVVVVIVAAALLALANRSEKSENVQVDEAAQNQSRSTVTTTNKSSTKSTGTFKSTNNYYQLKLSEPIDNDTTNVPGTDSLVEQTLTRSTQNGDQTITINVNDLAGGGLAADSTYAERQKSSDYSLGTYTSHGESIKLTTEKKTGTVTGFWVHKQYLALIEVSGDSGSKDQLPTLKLIADNLTWVD
jgi:hypothetical protein